ncbi:MAG: YlxR family protein [Bacilli bacterium]|nr:YlxR family protein [Bacilli bacterium]
MQVENPRFDIATRTPYPKAELIRLGVENGRLVLSPKGGRGFYLHPKHLDLAIKNKAFQRYLHRPLEEDEIALLQEAL